MKIIDLELEKPDLNELLKRERSGLEEVRDSVLEIISNVKDNGDKALIDYEKKFDGADLSDLRVTEEEIKEAESQISKELKETYKEAAENIRSFHEKQKEESWQYEAGDGIILGQQITPIEEVGVYVPGGKAAYPSTLLMDTIPAQVAGVSRIVVTTPPGKDGKIDPHILTAAKIVGVDEIYKLGGAQAIAALSYGTESVAPVSKIVGPGNIFVAAAKKEVFGKVSIDMIAGPSEVLIISDGSGKPEYIASDLLAQAEHDEMAMPVFITTSKEQAKLVKKEIERQLKEDISRKEIAGASVKDHGFIFITKDIDQAIELANEIAPEHLELMLEDLSFYKKIKNAGAIFLGEFTPEPVGDYFAGPNHTLPTSSTAKFSSPLGVYDFQKRSSLLNYSKEALNKRADKIIEFAESEGLDAHASAVRRRKE